VSRSRLLAIETSCDETAAAVVADGRHILSNVVSTQIAFHAPFGGVVPELASRHHLENICPVIARAMADASIEYADLDAVAVTQGPGLVGSLLVGLEAAKAIAWIHGKPLIPVHHIAGHIEAPFLAHETVELPAVALIVSGGHTSLFEVAERGDYRLLARTRDDAAGEAFDKVAKLLGLGYPGGPVIDRLSEGANDRAHEFTIAKPKDGSGDFSFSGIKTAVLYHVRRVGLQPASSPDAASSEIRDLVASFQRAVVAALVRRMREVALARRPKTLLLSGGVAANRVLRREAARAAEELGLALVMPEVALSTDNAAMIGAAGFVNMGKGLRAGLDLDADPHLPLL
jgi:tRNA N6-adenosine threonylcarbamoyltransferase